MKYFIEMRDFLYYRRKGIILLVGSSILFFILFFLFLNQKNNVEYLNGNNEVKQFVENMNDNIINEENLNSINKFVVDIKGEVIKPGIYEVDEGLRVGDVIALAGGLSSEADTSNINLSKKITDEMVIVVSKKEEIGNMVLEGNGGLSLTNFSNSDGKISINSASLEELITIKGIGEVKARAIIDYRNENGEFKSIEDILKVSGIGTSTFAKIKDFIKL